MVTLERNDERGDELQELRNRYNRLCAMLAFDTGASTLAGERLLQELQSIAQRIVAMETQRATLESTQSTAAAEFPTPAEPTAIGALDRGATQKAAPSRTGNVIAFRVKMKRIADPQSGFMSDDDALPPVLGLGHGAKPPEVQPEAVIDVGSAGIEGLRQAIADQGQAILLISNRCADHRARLMRIEERLAAATDLQRLSAEVATLREGSQKQHEQLAALATTVLQLARRLVTASDLGAIA